MELRKLFCKLEKVLTWAMERWLRVQCTESGWSKWKAALFESKRYTKRHIIRWREWERTTTHRQKMQCQLSLSIKWVAFLETAAGERTRDLWGRNVHGRIQYAYFFSLLLLMLLLLFVYSVGCLFVSACAIGNKYVWALSSMRKKNERETVSITNKFHSIATVRCSNGFLAI